jgi:hypothetical protein
MTPKPTVKTRGLFSHFYQEKPLSRKPSSRMFGLLLGVFAGGMLMSPEAFAVKDAEKRKGVIHA